MTRTRSFTVGWYEPDGERWCECDRCRREVRRQDTAEMPDGTRECGCCRSRADGEAP